MWVREGASLGGMGSAESSPIGVWGEAPEALHVPRYEASEQYGISYRNWQPLCLRVVQTAHAHVLQQLWV